MINKSLKINGILNGIRIISTMIFPIVTFPYVSRILQVENLGKVNFAISIISYFLLIATLGISNYAIREGARLRDTKSINDFASEVFSINVISTLISYVLLILLIILIPQIYEYRLLIILYSGVILFTTLGVEWVFSIYEDYLFITIRTIVFQFFSLIILFAFVKDESDLYTYTIILVLANAGPNLVNLLYSRKFIDIKFSKHMNLKKHLKPILVIFSVSVATTIYVNSDMTMLGLFVGNYSVGLYGVSVKIYSILKMLLSAIILVSLPRLSSYLANNKIDSYNKLLSNLFNSLIVFSIPISLGLFLLSRDIIIVFSGIEYVGANFSLKILGTALVFSTVGSFLATSVLLPLKKERVILVSSIISACINIFLNFFFIPIFKQDGAALTTLVSEIVMVILMSISVGRQIQINNVKKNLLGTIIGCSVIFITYIVIGEFIDNTLLKVIAVTFAGGVNYFISLLIMKNEIAYEILNTLKGIF